MESGGGTDNCAFSADWYFKQLDDPEFLTRSDLNLYTDTKSSREYLSSVLYQLENHRFIYQCSLYKVAAILLNTTSSDIQRLSLDVIEKIVLVQPEQVEFK